MHSLLLTFLVGLIGLVSISFGLLYKQDGTYYPGLKWYEVLQNDMGVRISFWAIGLALLGWAGFVQFKL